MDAAERALLATTVSEAIADADNVDDALSALGWLDMLVEEPNAAIEIVFTALGAANATATALDDVIAIAIGETVRPDVAVLLPPFGAWEFSGEIGLATARVTTATELLVPFADDPMAIPIADIQITPIRGLDPDARLHTVFGDISRSTRSGIVAKNAVAVGQRALAHQMNGASRAMLELACAHALEREQFGQPVARFQAVRHRLAEALVAIEAAEAAAGAAADAPNPMTAALAKAIAGRSARTVARHAQQVLAGIGFTVEHPFHRYMKRTMLLDGLFGSTDALTVDVGHQVLTTRTVPTLIEL